MQGAPWNAPTRTNPNIQILSKLRQSLVAAALLLVTACARAVTPTSTPSPSLTPTATSQYSTISGPITRVTLPASWTPTFTATATLTATPTPITPTPSFTPVPDLATLCDSLTINNPIPEGHTYGWNDVISLIYGTTISAVRDPNTLKVITLNVRFLATNTASGQNLGAQLPGGLVTAVELPVNQLPGPGDYTWKISVNGDGIGDQCVHQGMFKVTQTANDLLTSTALRNHELDNQLTATAISATQISAQATEQASEYPNLPVLQ